MQAIKTFFREHSTLTLSLLLAVLVLRLIVPVGFMPVVDGGKLVVSICTGSGPAKMVMDMPGMDHKSSKPVAEGGCAFADLSMPTLAGTDPIQLAALVALIMASGLVFAVALAPRPSGRLRPPLRGPPALA